MREFFKQELKTLYAKTQMRQYETISAMPDAANQFKALLDALERVCNQYAYIPPNSQRSIVLERMLSDDDFIGFNAKIVSKWFNQAKDKYFHESHHTEVNDLNTQPQTFEDLSEETKSLIKNFEAKLLTGTVSTVPRVSQKEIDDLKIEDLERSEGKKAIGRPSAPAEYVKEWELRNQWMRENVDPLSISGKLKEGGMSWEEWNKQLTKQNNEERH